MPQKDPVKIVLRQNTKILSDLQLAFRPPRIGRSVDRWLATVVPVPTLRVGTQVTAALRR